MKKRFVVVGLIAVVAFATGRWACDDTIRDRQVIDRLVHDATWFFPDATRPAIRRVHAAQTRSGRMGGRQEHLYVEFARSRDFEEFIVSVTRQLDEADAKQPGRWNWDLRRDVQRSGEPPSSEAPPWWPGTGRADVVLSVHGGATLIAPAGSNRIYVWYFVP
jgi:hypothetical protein